MAVISKQQINRQLRFVGGALRKLSPYYTEETLVKMADSCDRFLTGKCEACGCVDGRNSEITAPRSMI